MCEISSPGCQNTIEDLSVTKTNEYARFLLMPVKYDLFSVLVSLFG